MVWIVSIGEEWMQFDMSKVASGPVVMELDEATFARLRSGELEGDSAELRAAASRVVPISDAVACAVFMRDLVERTKAIR